MNSPQNLLFLLLTAVLFGACEGFFGTKTDPSFLEEPQYDARQVAYVPIQPALTGLDYPVDVVAGWDELIYVADAGADEIISFDQGGNELGRFSLPGLRSIAQDRRLDLLALGTYDTTVSGRVFSLPAIYRIDLNAGGSSGYGLANAQIKKVVIHPFYFKTSTPTGSDEQVIFQSVDVLADNRYFVSRNGPSNSSNQFGGPDDAVLLFDEDDKYISPVLVNTQLGQFNNYFKSPKGISTKAKPPQTPAVNARGDFVFTSSDPATAIKVQVIQFIETDNGASFNVLSLPVGDTTLADGFLYEPFKFESPYDVTIAGDGTNYIFVVDAEKDSLYQFNALGLEGVTPPAGANFNKAILASFGGTGEGLTNFREPKGVAYLDRLVYVADAGNGRVLRFKLTTDFE